MGSLGDVGTDSAAIATTGACLSYSWDYSVTASGVTTTTAQRCYFCNGKASGSNVASDVFFSAFVSPVYQGLKVTGIVGAVAGSAAVSVTSYFDSDATTNTALNTQKVGGCSGPS